MIEPLVRAPVGVEAEVISAAESLLARLQAPLDLDDTLQSLERLQTALVSNHNDRDLWLAGGVYVGRLLRRMVPDATIKVMLDGGQLSTLLLEARPICIVLMSWPPDPDRSLPFTFRAGQMQIRTSKGLSGKRPFCLQCGRELTPEETAEMEEFSPKHQPSWSGRRRSCPSCGTAIMFVYRKPQNKQT